MLRCFVGLGIPTVVVSSDPDDVTLSSRHCLQRRVIAPATNPDRAAADLMELGRSLRHRAVLFYGTDALLALVSRFRRELSTVFRFRMPPAQVIEDLVDKVRFADFCRRRDLPAPPTVCSSEIAGPSDILATIGLPCVMKPATHTGWFQARARRALSPHKALVAFTADELARRYAEISSQGSPFVAQRYVPGGEDRIYSYHAYLDEHSMPLGELVGKKIRTYPKHAGVSTFLELVKEPAVLHAGRAVVERSSLVGPVKIDFKKGAGDGCFHLLEVNARFSLWSHLGATCGVNLPRIAYAELVGERVEPAADYRTSVRWVSFGNDLRALLRDRPSGGPRSIFDWLWSYRKPKIYETFAWDDPVPFLKNAVAYARALGRRVAALPLPSETA